MRKRFALFLCFLANIPAYAEEKETPIDFWGASHMQTETKHEQWKPKAQNALEVLRLDASSKKEEKKETKKSDRVLVITFGAVLVAGLAASVVSYRENARSDDGSLCCRSEPYIPGQKRPVLIGDPDDEL